ncbi:MAG: prephenate/arogenate dehydrogenase family protein [Hyphomicrobiales bacterium]|nr:prephenate/arogenate dehydrogenase family protein [Hyphomicrobiales bacterium]
MAEAKAHPEEALPFERLAIIGIGLIGSSIALAARRFALARRVVLFDISDEVRREARALGLGDEIASSFAESVDGADAVIICVPVGACGAVVAEIAPHLQQNAIVTDVGSVKGAVIKAVREHLPAHARFVPAHPVAGTENSGPAAGFPSLFVNRWCILTPPNGGDEDATARVRAFWEGMGANVELMSADHHDLVLAVTSHLPHLIAYNIVGTADDLQSVTQSEVIKFSAGGFRDFTRIAASDPTMWRDVFLHNKEAVLEVLARFNEDLSALARAIRWGEGDKLFELFSRTRAIRRGIVNQGQETAEPDFGRRKV